MPRTFLVRRDEYVESEIDNIELISCETDIPPSAADVDDRPPSLSCADTDVNHFRMLGTDRARIPLQPSNSTERSESKFFVNLDTGNIEQQASPLDMLANAALERSVPLATRNASSNDTNAMPENVNCGPLVENSRKNVTELSKSPRKHRAGGKENSPRKSTKRNQSLPSFASLAYTMVLSNQIPIPNSQSDTVCATSNGAKHTMPPVPVRNALPLVRRKLPINSPSFKVWNELKPSSVIHPSSPFLRSCQPEVLRSIQPEVKAKKQILAVTNPDVRREDTKENSSDRRAVEEAGSDTICENKRDAVVLKKKSTSENEACSESDTFVFSVNTESSNREENPKTEQVKECFPLRCPPVGHSTNSVIESVLSSEQSDNIVAQTSVIETFSKELITQNDEVSVLKTVSVHSEHTKNANSAKPKIWNPLFHEPTHTSITRVPIETASMSKSEKEVSEVAPHFKHASWHQPSAVYNSSTSSQNISHVKEQSPKEEKSTHAHSITSVPSSKSSLHKFSIDSILSRVEKHHEAKDANEQNSCPIQSTTQNDTEISTEPDTIQASKRMRLDENQPFPRQSVIVATSSAVPSLIRTSTPVLKPTEPETPHIDDKENISASATPVFLWNIPTKAASKQPGPIVYRHPALVAMARTNSSPNPKIPANVLLPILHQPSPIRSLKPTIGEVRNWNIPVPSQQMPSPIIVKQEPEIRNQIQVSPAIQMGPQHSPAVQITPHVAAAVPLTPQIPSAMQGAPQVSPAVQMAPPILPAPPTSSTHISFQKQQQPKVGGIQVYDESNSGNVPIPLSAEVELVNGGFGLKNPSFRPPKPSDITNVSKDPVTGNGKYACSVCKKEFALQRLLNRHLKCHSDTKRFLCTFCGKGFNDTFDLKRHTRIHTGVKPYKCSKCERSFTQRCSLESHCRKVHNIEFTYAYKQRRSKIYVCEECGHSTDDPEVHYVHLRDNHPNNPALSKCHDKRQFKFNENNTANRQTLSLPRT